VTNFRFDENRVLGQDVNCLRGCGRRGVCVQVEVKASLKKILNEVIGVTARGSVMVAEDFGPLLLYYVFRIEMLEEEEKGELRRCVDFVKLNITSIVRPIKSKMITLG
jgi:hypothetical protein